MVGASESSVRTVLEHLQSEGIVEMDKQGTHLSDMGQLAFGPLLNSVLAVKPLELTDLSMGEIGRSALIGDVEELTGQAWSFRDLAIREGAKGAILLEVDDDIKFLHSSDYLRDLNPTTEEKIKSTFPAWTDASIIVVVTGDSSEVVEYGLWRIIGEIVLKKS